MCLLAMLLLIVNVPCVRVIQNISALLLREIHTRLKLNAIKITQVTILRGSLFSTLNTATTFGFRTGIIGIKGIADTTLGLELLK